MANDTIDATQGLNTINYQLGDGVDSVSFALPRTYQYAQFLTAAENGRDELSTFTGTDYSNSYFATANQSLVDALPYEISSTLGAMHQNYVWGSGYVPGTVDPVAALAAFNALIDWIQAPAGNVIQFGPGIKPSDVMVQVGTTADFGTPVQFAVALNNEAGMVFGLAGTQAVAGDTSVPPVIDMQFQFDDGTSASLADLLARPGQGVIGTQTGADGNDFLHGSLSDDTLLGNDGSDKLDGGAGADQLFGGPGNDVISGGSGNDTIYGEDGSDVMAASKDGGFMSGGAGDDVYCFNRGDGPVNIDNQDWDGSGVDTISFGKDVAPSDLVASVDPWTGNLTLAIVDTTDTITIPWFDPWSGMATRVDEAIDRVQFFEADGTAQVYDLASLVDAAFPDPAAVTDASVTVALVSPGSAKKSFAPAGGDAARSYALTGNLFPSENSENHAPTAIAIADQKATQDAAFSFVVPGDTFSDIDVGDTLKYKATLADGSVLPSWLKFDSDTGTFSGTPSNADVGSLSVQISATDGGGASASSVFALKVANVNDAPTLAHGIGEQKATQDAAFSFVVPGDTFADIDVGDTLKYGATLADGSALPSWLKFDPSTRTFSGTPGNADVGSLSVQISATDSGEASASSVFALKVANVNDAPTLAHGIADQSAKQNVAFSYTVPADTFADIDAGDTLSYSAKLADGSALPSWLHFDMATRTLSGTPSSVGQWSIQLQATDLSGASVLDVFTLTADSMRADPNVITGTKAADKLYGASGDDKITGGKGEDLLFGGSGDDTLYFSQDAKWGSLSGRTNASTGEKANTPGLRRSYDVFDGGTGYDALMGTSGSDAILLDDSKRPRQQSGPRIVGVEKIDAGAGNDLVDLTSKRYKYGDVEIDGGSGNDVLWSSSGKDVLRGGSGNDRLDGGAGNDYLEGGSGNDKLKGGGGVDVLQGGSGNDQLTDTSGNGVLDGGKGKDTLTEGSGNSLLVGGQGDDDLYVGGGYDIIAFNRGDGRDVVSSGKGGTATLSLGGGIRYEDLSLRRSGNDLILEIGGGERITFAKWYQGKKYQAVSKLQVVVEAMTGLDSADHHPQVETYNFTRLVNEFDAARRQHPGLSKWTLTNAMTQFHLSSGTEALGGDLAWQYGANGTLAGIALQTAQDTVRSSQFGTQAQALQSESKLKDGLVKLS